MGLFVGVKEAGEILGWDRRKVSTYHLRGVFPTPLEVLSSGPVWFKEQIEYYKLTKVKEVPFYYYDGNYIFQCDIKQEKKKTELTLAALEKQKINYVLWKESDVQSLMEAIMEQQPFVRFFSSGSISIIHDFGILPDHIYSFYLENYTPNAFLFTTINHTN
ncbi:hypothetical protein [Niallia sp. NCCP-28]|uniref:hypothetical protein n=1 Tax=Niallia sp. NCCP-28 TaxID=2934712 RepID=UPI0020848245|nr:hypothetical protein [Niallia sp. NCCP-28]GKU83926.1 hypothetical protein NCCP28_33220 [Niallia sp. NCCP-28]